MAYPLTPSGIRQCCHRAALDTDAVFCGECGSPLRRCVAYEECNSLLSPAGHCPVCVSLGLSIDAGAATSIKAGGVLSIPLLVDNTSPVGRPIFVTRALVREDNGAWQPVALPWERLEPMAQARLNVRTGVIAHAGVHQVDMILVVASRYMAHEETYAFSTSLMVPVETDEPTNITTNIHIGDGAEVGHGMTVYNPTRIEAAVKSGDSLALQAIDLPLARADRFERATGLRGYKSGEYLAPDVLFEWRGFDTTDAPDGPSAFGANGQISLGRASRQADRPSDVRLLVQGPRGINEELSKTLSRQHLSLYVENDRLTLRVDGQNGARVNGQHYKRGAILTLDDGASVSPIPGAAQALALTFEFEAERDAVRRVVVRRQARG